MRTLTSPTDGAPPAPARHRPAQAEAGFTLIELLAVIAILALAITAFTMGGRHGLDTARLRALLLHSVATLREARADAMRAAGERVVTIDLRHRRLAYAAGHQELALPDGVELTATVASAERYGDGTAGIRFYPTGASSGGVLAFAYRGQVYEIRVNWLTGDAALGHV